MRFQNSLGIDIQNEHIAIAYLKTSFRGVRLSAHAIYALEKDASQRRSDRERLEIVGEMVTDFMEENRIPSTNIFLGIPEELTICRDIDFPLAVKENLRSTLRYEMEKYIPLAADNVHFDYQILSEDKRKNRLKVLLVVAKKTAVEPYLNFSLSSPRTGARAKGRGGLSGIESSSTALINFFAYTRKKRGAISHRDVLRLLKSETEMDARIGEFSRKDIPSRDLVPAFGIALKGVWNESPMQVNLLPPELQKKPGKAGYYTMLFLAVMLILSGIAWGGSHILKQRLMLKELDTELTRLRSDLGNLDQIRTGSQELKDMEAYLNSIRSNRVSVLEILKELTQVIPETAWIQEITFSKKGMQLNGYAESASDLIPLLEDSPLFKDAVFSSTITKGKDGKERFRIGLKVIGQ